MAYQKLNASRAWKVIPTDDGIIPEFMVKDGTGTTTGTSANGFKDATVNFLTIGVKRGMVVVNPALNTSYSVNCFILMTIWSMTSIIVAIFFFFFLFFNFF